MGVLQPAPAVLGTCSLTAAVEMVCFAHLIVCVVFVSIVDSVNTVNFAGVEISPLMQCLTGAWFLLGIPVVIVAGVGAVYRVESHMPPYLLYLLGTFGGAIMWIILFIKYGNTCSTLQPVAGASSQASFVCGLSNGMVIFWMLMVLGVISGAMYLVWSMKEYIQKRVETELIRYQEPWQMVASLADDIAAEQAKQVQMLNPNQPRGSMVPPPYCDNLGPGGYQAAY